MVVCNLQSKCRKPSGHMGPLSQVEHSMRQGPEGLHSQNLLQSEGLQISVPLHQCQQVSLYSWTW